MYRNPLIQGFMTNRTLMRRAGVTDYRAFATGIVRAIPDRPVSFEVFSDEPGETDNEIDGETLKRRGLEPAARLSWRQMVEGVGTIYRQVLDESREEP